MAFLSPHFDCDVFVSYSHGDVFGEEMPLRDWTRQLIARLVHDTKLADEEFDNLSIWCDEQNDPTLQLTEELRGKVSSSGILMIVMSLRYLTSAWCKQELKWFEQQVEDRARDAGRVFIIRAQGTDETRWPDFLRDSGGHVIPGFPFHGKLDPTTPYRWRDTTINRDQYVRELTSLKIALIKRLRELRANAERRAKAENPKTPTLPARPRPIYLYARPQHAALCDEVKRALSQEGIGTVNPVPDFGQDIADWQRESRKRIDFARNCDALALLRGASDDVFDDDLQEIGIDERERIESLRGAPLPCAVLDRSGRKLPVDVSAFGRLCCKTLVETGLGP